MVSAWLLVHGWNSDRCCTHHQTRTVNSAPLYRVESPGSVAQYDDLASALSETMESATSWAMSRSGPWNVFQATLASFGGRTDRTAAPEVTTLTAERHQPSEPL